MFSRVLGCFFEGGFQGVFKEGGREVRRLFVFFL